MHSTVLAVAHAVASAISSPTCWRLKPELGYIQFVANSRVDLVAGATILSKSHSVRRMLHCSSPIFVLKSGRIKLVAHCAPIRQVAIQQLHKSFVVLPFNQVG